MLSSLVAIFEVSRLAADQLLEQEGTHSDVARFCCELAAAVTVEFGGLKPERDDDRICKRVRCNCLWRPYQVMKRKDTNS